MDRLMITILMTNLDLINTYKIDQIQAEEEEKTQVDSIEEQVHHSYLALMLICSQKSLSRKRMSLAPTCIKTCKIQLKTAVI